MQCYLVKYTLKGDASVNAESVDAKNLDSAIRKIERKRGPIAVIDHKILGYY